MTVEIPLSQGFVAIVDDEDAPAVLAAGKWTAQARPWTVYARRNVRCEDGRQATLYLHTFLTGWSMVDHANRDGLDNRRANLRPATRSQNARNRTVRSDSVSGFKGVYWDARAQRWEARIYVAGRGIWLGRFDDLVDAARAYDAAAREHYGEYAWLNFPEVTR